MLTHKQKVDAMREAWGGHLRMIEEDKKNTPTGILDVSNTDKKPTCEVCDKEIQKTALVRSVNGIAFFCCQHCDGYSDKGILNRINKKKGKING